MSKVEIENIGPVVEFSHEFSEPGVYELKGRQQSGKTTILRTVELATNGRTEERPSKRDGSKVGTAEVFGKTLKISRTIREDGELGIEGLGDLDLSTLHQPKFKDAETRDKYRIATLVRLVGLQADESLFYGLLGGKESFMEVVGDATEGVSDLLEMSTIVKRVIDKAALSVEKETIQEKSNCESLASAIDGVDINVETDETTLRNNLTATITRLADLKSARVYGLAAMESAESARKSVESSGFIDTSEVSKTIEDGECLLDDLYKHREEIERQIEQVENTLKNKREELNHSVEHNKKVQEQLDAIAKASAFVVPSEEQIKEAEKEQSAAQSAIEIASKARIAKESLAKLQVHQKKAKELEKKSEMLRKVARNVNSVLSEAISKIPNCPFKVNIDDDGVTRLVVNGRKESEFFDELSDGAKWTTIIPMLCDNPGKLIVLSQSAWGEIQPANKKIIDKMFKDAGCYLLTAQVDDGELRCERYSGKSSGTLFE